MRRAKKKKINFLNSGEKSRSRECQPLRNGRTETGAASLLDAPVGKKRGNYSGKGPRKRERKNQKLERVGRHGIKCSPLTIAKIHGHVT